MQTFIDAYNTMTLLSSYAEEFKVFVQRVYVKPQLKNLRNYFNRVWFNL